MTDDTEDLGTTLWQAVARLSSRFRSERAEGEVGEAALLVLIVLDKQDGRSLSFLAETARVTLGSMTQTVRRLEELGHVTKTRDTVDRRKVLFTLTDSGRAAAAASRQHRRGWLNDRLAELAPGERADVARVAALLLRLADS